VKLIRSLRARFIVGALLWTAGLLGVGHLASLALLRRHAITISNHGVFLLIAFILMAVGFFGARRGIAIVGELRGRLAAVRDGRTARLEGEYPSEVQPLVDDLNGLLDDRERMIVRAQTKAGDLAHGLKTPLAVLAQEGERLRAFGQAEAATTIGQQVGRMQRQIDFHLAHARAAASGTSLGAHCEVKDAVEALARTMQHLHADRGLRIEVTVDASHVVRGQREDLDEMLGNLLDNACKWAASSVRVTSERTGGIIAITVSDDGAGIDPSMRQLVMRRGVRADEGAPGSGLGLAIVRDLSALYGGSILLGASPQGGLSARLELPSV